jgi:Peptidase family M28
LASGLRSCYLKIKHPGGGAWAKERRMRGVVLLVVALLSLSFAFGTLAGCALLDSAPEPSEVAQAVTPDIDVASVREHLEHLTGEAPVSLEGGEKKTTISERGSEKRRKAAAEYMEASFEEAGVPARILPFDAQAERGYNVEATLEGSEGKKHLWVTAHMDSVNNAGAEDNASGLVMLLLAAEALEGLEMEHTVHFVAYDLEETGLNGSYKYLWAEVLPLREREGEEAIIGNINADMIGYEEDEFNAVVSSCKPTGPLDEALVQASEAVDPTLALREDCTSRLRDNSDHAQFLVEGLPAVLLVDGAKWDDYPCYHKPCDTADKVNVAYLRAMTRLVATAIGLLAVAEPGPSPS